MIRDDIIDLYFSELDLGPRWRLRDSRGAVSPQEEARLKAARVRPEAVAKPEPSPGRGARHAAGNAADGTAAGLQKNSRDAALPNSESWFGAPALRSASRGVQEDTAPAAGSARPAATPETSREWDALEAEIRTCSACGLCKQRRQAVPGVGDRQADWLFVGEGPGAEEDQHGEPFVGAAGKLLNNMLLAIHLERGNNVYIANAVKCRPPNNRTPESAEMAACRPFLERQIALLQPKIIVVLGRAAAHTILGSDDALSSLRGRVHRYGNTPVVVTYHPAYLLRTLHDKAKAWEDLCLARQTLQALRTE